MSKLEVDAIEPQSGTTITIGASGDTVNLVGTLQNNGSPLPGDISEVIAGTGLSGGGSTGAVTINIEAAQPTITSLGTITGFTSTGIDDNATSTAITINSSQNVGIGTASPSQLLHVYSTVNEIARIETNQTEGRLSLKDATGDAILKFRNDYRFTNSSGELARLDSSGNLGIGTSAPNAKLDILATGYNASAISTTVSDYAIKLASATTSNYFSNGLVFSEGNTSGSAIGSFDGGSSGRQGLWFATHDGTSMAERVRIDSSGNLGIGTSSASARLSVDSGSIALNSNFNSSNANGAYVRFQNSGTSIGDIGAGASVVSGGTAGDFAIASRSGNLDFGTGSVRRMRIDSSGNVGIGETAPLGKLHVKSADSGASVNSVVDELVLEGSGRSGMTILSGSSSIGAIAFGDSGSSTVASINYDHSDNNLNFFTNSAERMRITSSGNVGIGTVSPSSRFNILESTVGTDPTADSSNFIKLTNSDVDTPNEVFGIGFSSLSGGTDYLGAFVQALGNYSSNFNHSLIFGTRGTSGNATERMRITSAGNVLVNTTSTYDTVSSAKVQLLGALAVKIATTGATTNVSFFNNNGRVGFIGTSGTSTSYNTSSDYRLKENLTDITDATDRVKQLQPKRFNFIADANTTVDGFVAHEVSSVVPEAVTGEKDAVDENGNPIYQGIDQSKLVPLLVKTIQELEARITTLEANNP